jgi:hypothetical protein
MAGGGRVLIVERLIPDDLAAVLQVLLSDMNMLVFSGTGSPTAPDPKALHLS